MVFNSADLMRVPWELLIKDFRDFLGEKSFNTLKGYAEEFFKWLDGAQAFFPDTVQREILLDATNRAALNIYTECQGEYVEQDGEDGDTWRNHVADYVNTYFAHSSEFIYANRLTVDIFNTTRNLYIDDISAELTRLMDHFKWPVIENMEMLATCALRRVLAFPAEYFSTAGLVFAGFGDDDVFPAMQEYSSAGYINNTAISSLSREDTISHQLPASLTAFAQTSMADTFTLGFSADVYSAFMDSVRKCTEEFAKSIVADSGGELERLGELSERASTFANDISEVVFQRARREHSLPMKQVLGVLPVDEMAELAETLVNLQSLKEKVTKPSASVGGPIDVAIITRNEGLVWVKRKKFFESDLNPRYMMRQSRVYR